MAKKDEMTKRNGFVVMAQLIGLVKPLVGYMVLAIVMGLIGHLFAAFITVMGGVALLDALGMTVGISLKVAFVSLIAFAILRGALRYAEQLFNHYIAFKLLATIRDRIFGALRRLTPAKLEGKDRGDLISVITSDIELLEVFYAHTISPVAIALFFSLLMSVFVGVFHWIYGIIALVACITVGMIVPLLLNKLGGEDAIRFRNASGELSGFVLDSMRGLDETIQYQDGDNRYGQMNQKTADLSKLEKRMQRNVGLNGAITNGVILLFDLTMLLTGVFLYQRGIVDFAGLLLPFLALMSSFGPCVALANLGSTLQNTLASGNRVLDILEETPLVEDVTNHSETPYRGAEAKNVTFSYGEETILRDLSVKLPEDKIVGIVGRSGSGKSTLLKLFMRFWKVQQGEVTVSGRNVETINTENLRDMESFVTQETHLFRDSIRNNLRIAKLDATDKEIETACKKASIHDFIMSLPQGYDTPVGELGDTLSGGEGQRLGLARAFLHDAPLMLLDEPTSNLDSLNEAVILKSLHEQRKGRTVVLVSHRPSTMRIADQVYSVENGRVS